MKETIAKDLKEGDIFYYLNGYWIVVTVLLISIKVKCIMAPTIGLFNIGDYNHLPKYTDCEVKLLVRDGVAV